MGGTHWHQAGEYDCSDTLDAVKQSAALCLLRLIRNAPDSVQMTEWSSRLIHLLNDQHMVSDWRQLVNRIDMIGSQHQ